jgi:hypothetical protein
VDGVYEPSDTAVAQGVYRAHLVEKALHDRGPWYVQWSGLVRRADRYVEGGIVNFRVIFEVEEIPDEPSSLLNLMLRDHVVATRLLPDLLEVPRDQPLVIDWRVGIEVRDLTDSRE